jgi:pimeloyl-ACP methyl ester carboxylesterase
MVFLRRTSGGALLAVAVLFAIAGGVLGLLGMAAITAVVPLLATAGLLTMAGVGFLTAWPAFALLREHDRKRSAVIFSGVLGALIAVLAGLTIFRPMSYAAPAAPPAGVRFWNLPAGSRVAYTVQPATGPRRATPVIFLHGGPGTPGEGLPPSGLSLTAHGFDVYAYDQVGAGRSSRLSDVTQYTVARQVADLEAIRRTIGAPRIILVGRSWGGTLAAAYLAAHPDRVAKVVFSSPGEIWRPAYPHGTGDLSAHLTPDQRNAADKAMSKPRLLAAVGLLAVNPNAAHALVPDAEADAGLRGYMLAAKDATQCASGPSAPVHDNLPGFYVNQMTVADTKKVPDPRPRLRSVHIPALIMRAQCDYIDWAVTREYRAVLPNSRLVYIKGAGHGVENEQPALFRNLLRNFLLDRPLSLPDYTSNAQPH